MALDTVEGFVGDKFAAVRDAFEANLASGADLGASFCATKDGEMVVDLWGGFADEAKTRPWEKDTIVNVYSTTKTMTLHQRAAAGRPRRARLRCAGRQVLAGVRRERQGGRQGQPPDGALGRALGLARDDHQGGPLRLGEGASRCSPPRRRSGSRARASGYHAITQGYLIGEVVRRITGKTIGTFFREEIAGPLGADFWIGLPASEDAPRRRPDPAAAGAATSATWRRTSCRRSRFNNPGVDVLGDPHPGLARRRDPGRRRHRQRPLGGARSTSILANGGVAERQALHVGGRLPQGAGAADRRDRPDPRHAGDVRHGLRPRRRRRCRRPTRTRCSGAATAAR